MEYLIAVLITNVLVFGIAGGVIRQNQGGSFGEGLAWGLLLGFIGLIVVLATKPSGATSQMRSVPAPPPSGLHSQRLAKGLRWRGDMQPLHARRP